MDGLSSWDSSICPPVSSVLDVDIDFLFQFFTSPYGLSEPFIFSVDWVDRWSVSLAKELYYTLRHYFIVASRLRFVLKVVGYVSCLTKRSDITKTWKASSFDFEWQTRIVLYFFVNQDSAFVLGCSFITFDKTFVAWKSWSKVKEQNLSSLSFLKIRHPM